jgi:uncharacterized membrane protein YdfJ with MMPL/SSD domain
VELNLANFADATKAFPNLRAQVHSSLLTVHAAGDVPLNSAFGIRSEQDLQRADVSIPAALILLVIVFGSLVAALLCLGVGLVAVAGGLAAMYALTQVTDVSTYALNVVVILGLGVAIDYSLFIVSRFREELRRQASVEAALSLTMQTAGTAVAYSGITVAVGATALLFYSGTILTSMGLSGSFMVLIAVVYALTFLPALLAILGERVNHWRPASLLRPIRRSPITPAATAGKARSLPHPAARNPARWRGGSGRGSPTWSCATPWPCWCPASACFCWPGPPSGRSISPRPTSPCCRPATTLGRAPSCSVRSSARATPSTWCSTSTDRRTARPMWPSPTSSARG